MPEDRRSQLIHLGSLAAATRREDARQNKIAAEIEDNRCQVCRFHQEYPTSKAHTRHIVEVDHIKEKSKGGDERMSNLWVLCPNCHAKKTFGLLTVDVHARQVLLEGEPTKIRDSHLFVD